ncbi:MAG: hypothetical protein ACE5E9_06195 [Nitrospinaceae bacterium]
MFEEVRIYSSDGTLKKIVKSQESSKRFWDNYYQRQTREYYRPQIHGRREKDPKPVDWKLEMDDWIYWEK